MEVILMALSLALGQSPSQAAVSKQAPAVLFMCPHGAAKSRMASAYFQKMAKERVV